MLSYAFNAGLWTILFWLSLGLALGGLLAWLLGSTSRDSAQSLGAADFEGKTVTVRDQQTVAGDQLEAIEGIGPQIAQLFRSNGVHRFSQISAMSPGDISKILAAGGSSFALAQPYTWPFQARLLENGWVEQFIDVAQRLKGGRLAVGKISGIGAVTAQQLASVDMSSVDSLATADPAALSTRLSAAGESLSEAKVTGFINEAKKLVTGDLAGLAAYFGIPAAVLATRAGEETKETREVSGPIVGAQSLVSGLPVAAAASSRGSLLPFWLGLIGAALLLALCFLGIWCPGTTTTVREEVAIIEPAPVVAPVIPEGEGLLAELRDGRPALIIYFATAKSDVTNQLGTESASLAGYLTEHANARLSVSGYVDPTGDPAFNEKLAKSRAENVRAALVASGIAADRIDLDKPADIVADESSMANERKVEVTVKE